MTIEKLLSFPLSEAESAYRDLGEELQRDYSTFPAWASVTPFPRTSSRHVDSVLALKQQAIDPLEDKLRAFDVRAHLRLCLAILLGKHDAKLLQGGRAPFRAVNPDQQQDLDRAVARRRELIRSKA